jgi:hypothetical protein
MTNFVGLFTKPLVKIILYINNYYYRKPFKILSLIILEDDKQLEIQKFCIHIMCAMGQQCI